MGLLPQDMCLRGKASLVREQAPPAKPSLDELANGVEIGNKLVTTRNRTQAVSTQEPESSAQEAQGAYGTKAGPMEAFPSRLQR